MNKNIASLTLSFATALAAGCGAGGDSMSQEDYDDVAVAVGSMVAGSSGGGGEAGAMSDSMAASEGQVSAVAEGQAAGAIEVVVRGGITFEYEAQCFGSDGAALLLCDGSADAAEVSVSWSGSFDGPRYDVTVSRTGTWTISGLQSATAELDGSATFDLQSHFDALYRPVSRDLTLAYDATYEAVLIDTETRQVVGGSIRYSIDGVRTVEREQANRQVDIAVDAVVTFQADGTAELVLDGERNYVIDLDSGEIIAEGGARLSVGADQ